MKSMRESQNGIASPRWPTTIRKPGKRSKTPLTISRSMCSPVSTANP